MPCCIGSNGLLGAEQFETMGTEVHQFYFIAMNPIVAVPARLSAPERKLLQTLLAQPGYCASPAALRPSAKASQATVMAIAQSLRTQTLIDYQPQIERFTLTQRGRMLFRLEMAARPVTPDEWRLLQACRKGPITLEQIPANVPASARQALLHSLEQRDLIKVLRQGAAELWLTPLGQTFARLAR